MPLIVAGSKFGEVIDFFVAGAICSDVRMALFVAGSVFGDIRRPFFVAGAIFGEVVASPSMAGAIFSQVLVSFLVAGSILANGEIAVSFFAACAILGKAVVSLSVAGAISFCKAGAIITISQQRDQHSRVGRGPRQCKRKNGWDCCRSQRGSGFIYFLIRFDFFLIPQPGTRVMRQS